MKYLKKKKSRDDWDELESDDKLDDDDDDMNESELEAKYYKLGD